MIICLKKCNHLLILFSITIFATSCGSYDMSDIIAKDATINVLTNPFPSIIMSHKSKIAENTYIILDSANSRFLFSPTKTSIFKDKQVNASFLLDSSADNDFLLPAFSDFAWKTIAEYHGNNAEVTTKHELWYGDKPVNGIQIKKHRNYKGEITITGVVPNSFLLNGAVVGSPGNQWMSISESKAKAALELNYHNEKEWSEPKQLYSIAKNNQIVASWEFYIPASAGGPNVPVKVLVDAENGTVLSVTPLAIHLDGVATLFAENSVVNTPNPADLTLPNLSSPGDHLESTTWRILNCQQKVPSSQSCAYNAANTSTTLGDFRGIPYSDSRYDELVAYCAISRSVAWNMQIKSMPGVSSSLRKDSWDQSGGNRDTLGLSETKKLTVYSRALATSSDGQLTYDNAQYLPGGLRGNENPAIVIGTGWEPDQGTERVLRYVGKDSDVIMHEFHHHIIFRAISETSGESGALHEGLADLFTYAITGNNKLGESIVPSSVAGGALRAGNLSGTISDYIKQPIHKAGQFFSSTLWDVRVSLGALQGSIYKADKIIWDALDLCASNETYYGFIVNLGLSIDAFAAANNQDAKALRVAMFKIFANRGFVLQPDENTGSTPASAISYSTSVTGTNSSAVAPTAAKKAKRASDSSLCGVIIADNNPSNNSLFLLSIMLLPFLHFSINIYAKNRQKQQKQRVKIKSTRRVL